MDVLITKSGQVYGVYIYITNKKLKICCEYTRASEYIHKRKRLTSKLWIDLVESGKTSSPSIYNLTSINQRKNHVKENVEEIIELKYKGVEWKY